MRLYSLVRGRSEHAGHNRVEQKARVGKIAMLGSEAEDPASVKWAARNLAGLALADETSSTPPAGTWSRLKLGLQELKWQTKKGFTR